MFINALVIASILTSAQTTGQPLRLLDGQPTRIFFTGNPHHPVFGHEKLTACLDRHFAGKSPVRVEGLADGRKDPVTNKPIPPAKIPELIRFVKPQFEKAPKERVVLLTYVIVEAPRTKTGGDWVKERADELEQYGRDALKLGASRVFLAEMVQPNHIMAGLAGNKFRRAGLQAFDAVTARTVPGIVRGPKLQELMEKQEHFFSDGRHFSPAGKDYIGLRWFETLLQHDGQPIPDWCQEEIRTLEKPPAKNPS